MRHTAWALAAGAATLTAGIVVALAVAPGASAGVAGSKHDFTGDGLGTTELCNPCHTPHFADVTVTDAPLWNHDVTTSVFQTYASGTLDATVGQPNGVSKLCLSCHDGTVAIDAFGGSTSVTDHFMDDVDSDKNLGTDLRNDHPISFTFDSALASADGELYDPSGVGIAPLPLFAGKLECATCHDVHGADGNDYFLRVDNDDSELCLTCHIK